MNKIKGLDLVDRVPEDYVQKFITLHNKFITRHSDQNHPKEKKFKKDKLLSVEALQIAEERRKEKGKGERESYIQLNAEFQRMTRSNKKAF